jgi:mannose-6-phosphate isomerase-like protein (cupin superfamily)
LADAATAQAPDGSTVRPLCALSGLGSFAHFQLEPGEVAKAVSHATVQEIWFVVGGAGEMWRRQGEREETLALRPGVCLTIPLGCVFQFRSADGNDSLQVVAVTMPPWPPNSPDEAKSRTRRVANNVLTARNAGETRRCGYTAREIIDTGGQSKGAHSQIGLAVGRKRPK